LLIDEAHRNKNTKLAQNIIDLINPKVILHVTATPDEKDELEARRSGNYCEVPREEVVNQGLIKEAVVTQTEEELEEELKKRGGGDLDKILLECGMKKREEFKKEFKILRKDINPLMLIQLPNDDNKLVEMGERKKEEVVTDYLLEKGVPKHKIAK
jgi:type III restriction enzyme